MTTSNPGEAGKRAAELLVAEKMQQRQQQSSSSSERVAQDSMRQQQDTFLAHAGVASSPYSSHANISLAPSLEFATTYTRPAHGAYHPDDAVYTRIDNPTRVLLERTVGQLECSSSDSSVHGSNYQEGMTCAFASGMMAASSIVLAHKTPMTILLPQDLYHGVSTVMVDVFQARFGVTVKHVDLHRENLEPLEEALDAAVSNFYTSSSNRSAGGSILVWMETPSNPRIHVVDIKAVCDIVNRVRQKLDGQSSSLDLTTVVDSTMAPPVIQQPFQFGADLVMHSATKYLGGHSDALLGIVTASPFTPRGKELAPLLRQTQFQVGGVASPMDSWLVLRGLRTLHVRVERQGETALVLAKHLLSQTHKDNPLVTAVHYPGLESHPRHDVAQRQMKNENYGGVLSVELKSESLAMAFAGALQVIYRATSLGGTETLIEHRASIEPPGRVTSPPGLLRITVGLEDATDLIHDIDNALHIAQQVDRELA